MRLTALQALSHGAVLSGIFLALTGCVSVPAPPQDIAFKTDLNKPKNPSINARVINEASVIDSSFAGSLDSNVETLTRLESTYTLRFNEDAEQMRIGDTVSSAGLWGSSVRYGGVQFGTRLKPNDDVLRSQRLATNGIAVLPTAADALFSSVNPSASILSKQSLAVSGPEIKEANTLNLTASDAFGRSEAFSAPLVAQARLVESGCSDFAVGFGKVRRDFAVSSNDYGPTFANTTIACAAPFGFTVEGHGEYLAQEVAAIGLGLARRVGSIGTASFAVASSDTGFGAGWLARVGFEHQSKLLNFAVRSRMQSREFREVGSTWIEDPIMRRNLASIGITVGESAALAVAYAAQTTWERERIDVLSLNQKMNIGRGSVMMTAGHSFENDIGSSLFLSYKRPFGTPTRSARFDASDLELLEVTVGKKKL